MGDVDLKNIIYFDNAATTPPLVEHLSNHADCAEGSTESQFWFMNPSSPHLGGIKASRALEKSRDKIKNSAGFQSGEVVFTSGGTESNNIALLGHAIAQKKQGMSIFAEPWEHPSTLGPLKYINDEKLATVRLGAYEDWSIPSKGTVLITVSHVSHETGDVNDITRITDEVKRHNPEAIIHIDGAQGFCKETIHTCNVDMYSASAHKFHGPSGLGFLYLKKGIRLKPIFFGGSQEFGLSPGTESVGRITTLSNVIASMQSALNKNADAVMAIKSIMSSLASVIPDACINERSQNVSPYILNISFLGIKGEVLVHLLSEKGVYASMGAACRSRKKEKSALETMGFGKERAESSVRFSFSHLNTPEEANTACEIILDSVAKLRRVSRSPH